MPSWPRRGLAGDELDHFRSAANDAGIPLSLPLGSDETVSPFRIREFDAAFKHLHGFRTELFTHADLGRQLAGLNLKAGPRTAQLKAMQEHWKLETGGGEFPVQAFTSYMADCLLEARREQRVGKGVFTGTAHSVKGLEFRVVLVLDGHWQLQRQDQREEERRLFYVTMTRAPGLFGPVSPPWRGQPAPEAQFPARPACTGRDRKAVPTH